MPRLAIAFVLLWQASTAAAASPQEALERGVAAVLTREPSCLIVELWALQQVEALRPRPALARFLRAGARRCAGGPGAVLFDEDAPRRELPAGAASGLSRLARYTRAPLGGPPERAARLVGEFVARDETRYVLVHQWLVLQWAERTGLALAPETRERAPDLLRRIAAEQEADAAFSDLYVVRAALLAGHAGLRAEDLRPWVDTVVAAQGEGGAWRDPAGFSAIAFDGEQGRLTHHPLHTTAFALLLLESALWAQAPAP